MSHGDPDSQYTPQADMCRGTIGSLFSDGDMSDVISEHQYSTWNLNSKDTKIDMLYINDETPQRRYSVDELKTMQKCAKAVGKKLKEEQHGKKSAHGLFKGINSRFCPGMGYGFTLDLVLTSALANSDALFHLHQPLTDFKIMPSHHIGMSDLVTVIVPVSVYGPRLQSFLDMYEKVVLQHSLSHLRLVFVLMSKNIQTHDLLDAELQSKRSLYPMADISLLHLRQPFRRAKAIHIGVQAQLPQSLLFFCDIDITFSEDFFHACRMNSVPRQQVYAPIPFALYSPEFSNRSREYGLWTRPTAEVKYNISEHHISQVINDLVNGVDQSKKGKQSVTTRHQNYPLIEKVVKNGLLINSEIGHWMEHSYGMICIYRHDYLASGGFNHSISGWGGEDVDLADRLIQSKVRLFRSPEPALIHRWHEKKCNPTSMTEQQMVMCNGSLLHSIASLNLLSALHTGNYPEE